MNLTLRFIKRCSLNDVASKNKKIDRGNGDEIR